jgi:hypothetical protein
MKISKRADLLIIISLALIGIVACAAVPGQGIKGIVLLGPHCPVVQAGSPCPDTPFQTALVVTTPDGSRVIKEFSSDENGMFAVLLPPGEYAIRSPAGTTLPYCTTQSSIIVSSGVLTEATVYCDTGIR